MHKGRISTLLKERTATLHANVERSFDLPRRLRDRAAYADLLTQFYRLYQPLEDTLGRFDFREVGLDWSERRKTPALEADLVALDRDPQTIAFVKELPSIRGLGDALGCLYVMEGATLGGQIIRREVAARLGLSADRGCKFFSSYGDRVGEKWERFRSALDGYAVSPDRDEAILAAACATFETFDAALAEEPTR